MENQIEQNVENHVDTVVAGEISDQEFRLKGGLSI